mmetsp:Transcript_644/g.872  ORF Transcript_644/g.872 Transcript_644/m.872 type:complete len:99 (-) Transcript_644:1729-2025(-)
MYNLAFSVALMMCGLILLFLVLLQAAKPRLQVALFLSISMGLIFSVIAAIVAFEVDKNLNVDAIYKIMFISQLAAGALTMLFSILPCFKASEWQRYFN